MSRGRLGAKFVSWLDEAVEEIPQAVATGQQWLSSLKKNPKVAGEEIRDRGLDTWLAAQQGSIPRGQVQQRLAERPMPVGDVLHEAPGNFTGYGTRGLVNDYDQVYGNPFWDNRTGKQSHFDEPGYQFHTRGGRLEDTSLGNVNVLDEVQGDVRLAKDFNPLDPTHYPPLDDLMEGSRNYSMDLSRSYNLDSRDLQYNPYISRQEMDDADDAVRWATESFTDNSLDVPDELIELTDINKQAREYLETPRNMPGGKRAMDWQGSARGLQRAVQDDADALVWPAGEEHYRRYYQRSPEHYRGVLEQDKAVSEDLLGALADDSISAPSTGQVKEAESALNSLRFYENTYDKKMPNDKRWKQLGLEPELIDLGQTGSKVGKYWAVRLTPEIKERLAKQGIPYYAVGGMGILGQQDGAMEDGI